MSLFTENQHEFNTTITIYKSDTGSTESWKEITDMECFRNCVYIIGFMYTCFTKMNELACHMKEYKNVLTIETIWKGLSFLVQNSRKHKIYRL